MKPIQGPNDQQVSPIRNRALPSKKAAEEGGCGVVGYASTVPFGGRHILSPCMQMHNRGNGKGGGIAATGLCPEDLSVSQRELEKDYLIQIALLDPTCRVAIERKYITPHFHVDQAGPIPTVEDYRDIRGLEVKPPDVWRYFCRPKEDALGSFMESLGWTDDRASEAEDEFVFRNSFHINEEFYSSLGEKRAFVLSHGRDMFILKAVGYAEHVVRYYRLEDLRAHVWIGHQRYPTKGRVWHPGGAHPFIGLNEALVHNGDFANYHSVTEYLKQRGRAPQFLTDTEVAVLVFDLLNRTYRYPLEYIIEALAPTTELDFELLPAEKKPTYRAIRQTHIHGSPDGPWFFIIARTVPERRTWQLIGITDTAMLRPQVFALHQGEVSVGLIASEKQAIDATLESLSRDDERICPVADYYWNARGGSHTDGGAFIFSLTQEDGVQRLICTNKFGETVRSSVRLDQPPPGSFIKTGSKRIREALFNVSEAEALYQDMSILIHSGEGDARELFGLIAQRAQEGDEEIRERMIATLTLLGDRCYSTGPYRRNQLLGWCRAALDQIFDSLPVADGQPGSHVRVDWPHREDISPPTDSQWLVVDARDFPVEGRGSLARFLIQACERGWKRLICYRLRGHRFVGSGLGPGSEGVFLHVFGSSGDYLGSSMDGAELIAHGSGQDQVGQILKSGKLVINGDVGQTFLYGAKGGSVYVMGQAAGRPLINAVGAPRVVINGTCLDYLAESFMAGDPLEGGGFAVVNGLYFDHEGHLRELTTPYPGGHLLSLASGGAIYIRDPNHTVTDHQLNGGEFSEFLDRDWLLIRPYLEENQRLFGIRVDKDLLTANGEQRTPQEIYRKIVPARLTVLSPDLDLGSE
jgi:glutamate synthase domain-containing protein 1/glutamate synthase domain-containing protein 3